MAKPEAFIFQRLENSNQWKGIYCWGDAGEKVKALIHILEGHPDKIKVLENRLASPNVFEIEFELTDEKGVFRILETVEDSQQ